MKLLEKILLYVLVFSLPFNIKKFMTSPIKAEHLTEFSAIFLYLSDVLVFLLLALWFIKILKKREIKVTKIPLWGIFLVMFILILVLSLFWSQNLTLSIYSTTKVLLCIGLFVYLKNNLKEKTFLNSLKIISLGGVLQSFIALIQFIKQSSLGIVYLGESVVSRSLVGVAKIGVGNIKIIRSYGTFSHPNILGAFLLLALYCSIYLVLKKRKVFLLTLPFLVLGLILTFSRSILFFGLIPLIIFLTYKFFKNRKIEILRPLFVIILSILILSMPLSPLLTQRMSIDSQDQAVSLRIFYNKSAIEMIKKSPLVGVGLRNSTLELKKIYPDLEDWQYQPVHNIYLLIASEVGILGLLVFILFLLFLFKRSTELEIVNQERHMFLILTSVFLILGLFDHYFFTINQGIIIFWLILGITSTKHKKINS